MSAVEAITTAGRVGGVASGGLVRFRSIPFAAAPVGPLRFRPPARPEPWDGVRDCVATGAICPQVILPEGLTSLPDMSGRGAPLDEDCLNLNVVTPGVDGERRPVLVWIYGGAFVSGSNAVAMYDGARFAEDGLVYVAPNYRLHALGFMALDGLYPDAAGSGNNGLLDQVAALEWVHENIAAFGGDPDNVTVMGESAGAMSIGTLLGLPCARGLFRRAICLSGAAHHNLAPETAEAVARRVLGRLKVPLGDRDELERFPVTALSMGAQQTAFMEAAELMAAEHAGVRTVFAPVVDGTVLPRRAIDAVADGSSDGVDVMIGTCADEYRVFVWGIPPMLRGLIPTPKVEDYFGATEHGADEVLAVYGADRPGADATDLAVAVAGDAIFGIPAVRLAEAKVARGDRVWMHQLTWPTPAAGGLLGACHALDVPFVFDDLAYPGFLGDDPPKGLAEDLHGACVRFAATGNPNGGRLPPWPCYDSAQRVVMRFDVEATSTDDPRPAERQLWEGSW